MFRILKNNKGQGIAVQYVLTFFLVIGVVSAMSVYFRRALLSRIRDARNYMVRTVDEVYSGNLYLEYEPYYVKTEQTRYTDRTDTRSLMGSLPASSGIFQYDIDLTTITLTNSVQTPPKEADLEYIGVTPRPMPP